MTIQCTTEQVVHEAGVGLPLHRLHHLSDQKTKCLLLAGSVLSHRPGVGPAPGEEALDEQEALQEIEDWEVDDPDAAETGAGEAGYEARGRRGREDAEAHKHRSRVVQFLIAVWAELQRVQWPNRQALVTLTGVVLGFVLIAGGYLGLLDAIFSELIQALL